MAASSVRAAVVSKEHHHDDQISSDGSESAIYSRSRTSSRSSSGHSSHSRHESTTDREPSPAQDLVADLHPTLTSTPIVNGGNTESPRRRNRANSGNSVTFQGATVIKPDQLSPVLDQDSGVMANSPSIVRTNTADEIIVLEDNNHPLTSSTSSRASHGSFQYNDVQVQAPIVGYEVMEERARFTVFKIHVAKGEEDWFIFRRYTDFVRLNDKLKFVFPHFRLSLPPKKWFGDNFDKNFLDDRLLGLQAFLNNITSHRDVVNSEPVKDFFCYDDPPGAHDSLEESKALCEALEEKAYNLKRDLQEKEARIQLLEEEVALHKAEVENLRKSLRIERALNARQKKQASPTTASIASITSQRSDSSLVQDHTSYTEADQAQMGKISSPVYNSDLSEAESMLKGSDSMLTSPSSSSTDLLENLHDLKLHSIHQVDLESDPNANCHVIMSPQEYTNTTTTSNSSCSSINNSEDLVANNIGYTKQDSINTLVNEELEKSGELEWDEDDEYSSEHLSSNIGVHPDGDGISKTTSATLLPPV